MNVKKRDGRFVPYDESNVKLAMIHAGVEQNIATKLAKKITKLLKPPLTVKKIGDLIEDLMLQNKLHGECKKFILYRASRRAEREKRSNIIGKNNEKYKHMRPSTLRVIREIGEDVNQIIENIKPDCSNLILSGKFIPDDIIIHEGTPNGPYQITIPHSIKEQLSILQHLNKYAIYVDWNRAKMSFRDTFKNVCDYTGCQIREGRYGGMLDMRKISLSELPEIIKQSNDFLSEWPGAANPGIIIPPGMNHKKIHTIIHNIIPDYIPTAIQGKKDKIWGEVPFRGSCPECGGNLIYSESCMSCVCGWSACSS